MKNNVFLNYLLFIIIFSIRTGLVDEEFDQLSTASLPSLFNRASFPNFPARFQSLDDFDLTEEEPKGIYIPL